jgi:hypothetical protein
MTKAAVLAAAFAKVVRQLLIINAFAQPSVY